MSFNAASPTNYGFEGDPLLEAYMNAKFSEEISEKMKVPKRITANGMEIENHEILNGNQMNSWNYHEKLNMTVPDRIVVIGQDQHLGELKLPAIHFTFNLCHFPSVFIMFALFTFSRSSHFIHFREKCFSLCKKRFRITKSIFRLSISFCCCCDSRFFFFPLTHLTKLVLTSIGT